MVSMLMAKGYIAHVVKLCMKTSIVFKSKAIKTAEKSLMVFIFSMIAFKEHGKYV